MTSFDLRAVRLRPGEELREELPVELEPLRLGGERYEPVPAGPVATLSVSRASSGTLFRLRLAATLAGPCVRCLGDAAVELALDVTEYQATDPDAEELATPYLVDGRLELSAWARDAIALELPEQILCAEDCAGLCAGCGASLAREPCSCGPPEPDPRLSPLAELRARLEA